MNRQPPKYPLRFFRWFCNPDYTEDIEGDLLERFEKKPSSWLFSLEVLKLFRPGIIKNFEGSMKLNYYGMLKHYLLITLRSFKKDKSYTVINLFGLVLSISVSLLIWQYVDAEKSVDQYHTDVDNKYRVNYSYYQGEELKRKESMTSNGLGPSVQNSLAGIKNMVRVRPLFSDEGVIVSNGAKKFSTFGVYYVEQSFLEFFNYPLEKGEASSALSSPNSIVLTSQSAQKYFGNENPMGKTLHISAGAMTGDFVVTGVLSDFPSRTHLDFDYLVPIDFMLSHYGIYTRHDEWYWHNFHTYFELENGASILEITALTDDLILEKMGDKLSESNENIKTDFLPISKIYLGPAISGDGGLNKGNALNLSIFSIVAIVVLIVAGINYINLASARAIKKKDEVSLKKAIGANKPQIVAQFLFESLLLNLFAFGTSVFICYLASSKLSSLGVNMEFMLIQRVEFWVLSAVILLIVSLLTGIYPALMSIKLGSLRLARNQMMTTAKGSVFRKSLMGFQLFISLILVAATWLVYHQVNFMKNAEVGMATDQLFVVHGPRAVIEEGRDVMVSKEKRFKDELLKHPSILSITGSSNVPGTNEIWAGGTRKLGDPADKQIQADVVLVDHNFSETYDFEFLAGEPLREDMREYEGVLINEEALAALNISSPIEAVGKNLILTDWDTMRVSGVLKNVHWNSLHDEVEPTIFSISYYPAYFTIRVNPSNLQETLGLIENTYKDLYPKDPYVNYFLDDEFNLQYQSESQFGQIFGMLAFIAICISSLGLFSLIAYSISQKMKEIGIRKVLGASGKQVFQLLSKEYIQVFIIALLLSTPIVFYGAQSWLNNFAYRVNVDFNLFLIPALVVSFITFLVISNKIFAAMRIDPVKQLRDE